MSTTRSRDRPRKHTGAGQAGNGGHRLASSLRSQWWATRGSCARFTVIARRGNEGIFREMTARPAPNFPDALARNPQPLKFVPVDDHLVLDDGTMRVDVYHAVGHLHMAEAVFAYIPGPRIFLEGDFTTFDWHWNWWGGAYLDTLIATTWILRSTSRCTASLRRSTRRSRRSRSRCKTRRSIARRAQNVAFIRQDARSSIHAIEELSARQIRAWRTDRELARARSAWSAHSGLLIRSNDRILSIK